TVSGSAVRGDDYTALSESVTFGIGVSTVDVTVDVLDDSETESDESVIVTLDEVEGYGSIDYQAFVTIADTEEPIVTIQKNNDALEGVTKGGFTFTRRGDLRSSLDVDILVTGTATSKTDFAAIDSTFTFAAGAATVVLDVDALPDLTFDPDETVIVTIQN